jgi:hypothetical protein
MVIASRTATNGPRISRGRMLALRQSSTREAPVHSHNGAADIRRSAGCVPACAGADSETTRSPGSARASGQDGEAILAELGYGRMKIA